MIRQLLTIILIISLLAGNLFVGHGHTSTLSGKDQKQAGGCVAASTCNPQGHPCHDTDDHHSHADHCCHFHNHLPALTTHPTVLYPPVHEKQFTAIIPHFSPSDHLQERFIPPRHTA